MRGPVAAENVPAEASYRRSVSARIAALLISTVLAVLIGPAAVPATAAEDFPEPAAGTSWFGAELGSSENAADRYTDRLGSPVSLLSRPIDYPLSVESTGTLSVLAAKARDAGAVSVISLQPLVPLESLEPEDASALVGVLNDLTRELGSAFLIRFAPEMNGSWTTYGQRPTAYIAAFGDFAEVVHAEAFAAQTVWAPSYGSGYPFGGSINAPVRGAVTDATISQQDRILLDTNDNGRLDQRDDPYGPYFPGAEAADWVGLSVLKFGPNRRAGANTVAGARELEGRLDDTFGYPDAVNRPSFYQRYAVGRKKPMLLLTGALFNPDAAASDPTERAVKGAWLRQVLAAAKSREQIKAVVWLESTRLEPEVGGTIRWGLTSSPALGRTLGSVVATGAFDLGPVRAVTTPPDTSREGTDGAADGESTSPEVDSTTGNAFARMADATGLTSVQLALLLTVLVLAMTAAVALRRRRQKLRPPWL